MKLFFLKLAVFAGALSGKTFAQDVTGIDVPAAVKSALQNKYPGATRISWEKEKGNFEANWGGTSGEDSSASFTPAGSFVEIVVAIPVSHLPSAVSLYVKQHYKNAKIVEAGKVTDAAGKHMYEAEVKHKDLLFDEHGVFIKED